MARVGNGIRDMLHGTDAPVAEANRIPPPPLLYTELEPVRPLPTDAKPGALAVGPDGRIAVGLGQEVWLHRHGIWDRLTALRDVVTSLLAASEGWYASSGAQLALVDNAGNVTPQIDSADERRFITSLAMAEPGLLVADAGNRQILQLTKPGGALRNWPAQGSFPRSFLVPSPYFDVTSDGAGGLWAANPGERSLVHFGVNGEALGSFGRSSQEPDGFCGCCNPIHIARTPNGGLITAEKGICRVKEYAADGRFAGLVAGEDAFSPGTVIADVAVTPSGVVLVLDPVRKTIRRFRRVEEQ
jgi:hypothetical protein